MVLDSTKNGYFFSLYLRHYQFQSTTLGPLTITAHASAHWCLGACVKILLHSQIFDWLFGSCVTISPFRPVSFSHISSLLFSPLPSDMYGLILVSLWILSPPFGYCFLWGYLPSILLLAYLSIITYSTSQDVSLHV